MTVATPVDWRTYLPPGVTVPSGWLGERFRRIGMELGAIPPPPGTVRVERRIVLRLPAETINERTLKGWGFDARKVQLQGLFMERFDRLEFLLPRPIPSIGHDLEHAPIWSHARARFPKRASRRDVENLRTLTAKSLGDAYTGPERRWEIDANTGRRRNVPARRRLRVGDRVYVGGWLADDGERDWLFDMDIDVELGPAQIVVRTVWDELAP